MTPGTSVATRVASLPRRASRDATGRSPQLTVLARLGLRAGEVAVLRLDDIDWRAGEIVVRGKGRTEERLPLPCDVGEAIAAYLRQGRPASAQGRAVFVRVKAPHRAHHRRDHAGRRLGWAARRAGADPRAPAAPQRRDRHAPGWLVARGDRPGAAPSSAAGHRDLRQSRPRCTAPVRPSVAGSAVMSRSGKGLTTTWRCAGRWATSSSARASCSCSSSRSSTSAPR